MILTKTKYGIYSYGVFCRRGHSRPPRGQGSMPGGKGGAPGGAAPKSFGARGPRKAAQGGPIARFTSRRLANAWRLPPLHHPVLHGERTDAGDAVSVSCKTCTRFAWREQGAVGIANDTAFNRRLNSPPTHPARSGSACPWCRSSRAPLSRRLPSVRGKYSSARA